jgi:hypothetical protein
MIKRDEILDYVTYKEQRAIERPKIIEIKNKRRVHLGNYLTFLFENRDTIRYQIQEMTLAEKIVKDAEIQYEIDTYNQLFGEKGSLPCVLLVEIEDPDIRLRKLSEWYDLPKTLYVKTVSGNKVYAVYDEKQMSDTKLSSVQYLYFNTKGENVVAVGTDLPALNEEVELTDIQKTALKEDLADLSK